MGGLGWATHRSATRDRRSPHGRDRGGGVPSQGAYRFDQNLTRSRNRVPAACPRPTDPEVRSGNLRGTGMSRTSSPSINWWPTERPQPYLLPPSLGAVDNSPLAAEGSQLLSRVIVLGLTELFIHPRIISVLNRSTSLLSMKGSKLWQLKRK
jgi:hypothetical protein